MKTKRINKSKGIHIPGPLTLGPDDVCNNLLLNALNQFRQTFGREPVFNGNNPHEMVLANWASEGRKEGWLRYVE